MQFKHLNYSVNCPGNPTLVTPKKISEMSTLLHKKNQITVTLKDLTTTIVECNRVTSLNFHFI